MTYFRKVFVVFCVLAFVPFHVSANDDEGLYAPPVPDGSAFFRFVHADAGAGEASAQAGSKSYGTLGFEGVSTYFVTPEGPVSFSINGLFASGELSADHYYSVIMEEGGLRVLEDQKIENAQKSLIGLYNFTAQDALTLQTGGKAIAVVEDVASGQSGAREINALKIELDIVNADESVKQSLEPVVLERGQAFSVFAFQDQKGKINLKTVKAETDTTQ
jgi:hypothetical protein